VRVLSSGGVVLTVGVIGFSGAVVKVSHDCNPPEGSRVCCCGTHTHARTSEGKFCSQVENSGVVGIGFTDTQQRLFRISAGLPVLLTEGFPLFLATSG
jgi:hypothetical protein